LADRRPSTVEFTLIDECERIDLIICRLIIGAQRDEHLGRGTSAGIDGAIHVAHPLARCFCAGKMKISERFPQSVDEILHGARRGIVTWTAARERLNIPIFLGVIDQMGGHFVGAEVSRQALQQGSTSFVASDTRPHGRTTAADEAEQSRRAVRRAAIDQI
jgi:hypothetical protein